MQNKVFLNTVVLLVILVAFTILVIVKEEGKISDFFSSATAAPRTVVPPVGVKEVNNNTADNDDNTNNTIDVDNGNESSENEDQIYNSNIVVENNPRLAVLPYFVLHVGPSKSGTSTIQSEFDENKRLEKLLRQDNYTYIGNGAVGAVLDHTKLQKQNNMATGT